MGAIQKGIGIVALTILVGIGLNIYMGSVTSANTTGWSPMIISMSSNYLPLILLASVIIIVIMGAFVMGRGK
jgi:ABC-type antimicrobial peptide transport system permease subunit